MGLSIKQSEFTTEDFDRFAAKVRTDLTALTRLLDRPGFGEGEASIGAEVEFYIVNPDLRIQPINTEIAASVQDPQLTVELNRFNLEYNLSPQAFKGTPFARTEQELLGAMQRINQHARATEWRTGPHRHSTHVAPVRYGREGDDRRTPLPCVIRGTDPATGRAIQHPYWWQ
jgi:hypothetical protein